MISSRSLKGLSENPESGGMFIDFVFSSASMRYFDLEVIIRDAELCYFPKVVGASVGLSLGQVGSVCRSSHILPTHAT